MTRKDVNAECWGLTHFECHTNTENCDQKPCHRKIRESRDFFLGDDHPCARQELDGSHHHLVQPVVNIPNSAANSRPVVMTPSTTLSPTTPVAKAQHYGSTQIPKTGNQNASSVQQQQQQPMNISPTNQAQAMQPRAAPPDFGVHVIEHDLAQLLNAPPKNYPFPKLILSSEEELFQWDVDLSDDPWPVGPHASAPTTTTPRIFVFGQNSSRQPTLSQLRDTNPSPQL